MLLAILLPATAPTTASTRPATTRATSALTAPRPALTEMLDGGRVRYAPPPAPWTLIGEAPNDMTVRYMTDDGVGTMTVAVTPQYDTVTPEHAKRMALKIGEAIRAYAKRSGIELLYGPRVERDERFFLTVRDRMRLPDGATHDRLHMYRMIDSEMLSVIVSAQTDSEEQAKAIHAAARALLDEAKAGRGPTMSPFPRTGIRAYPPAEWVEKRVDDPNGVVATYAEPNGGPARLAIRSRVVPKKIRGKDGASVAQRDALIDDMLAASNVAASAERLPDEKQQFARAVRLPPGDGRKAHVEARYVLLGDTMIGVTITGSPGRAEHLAALVDRVTLAIQKMPGR